MSDAPHEHRALLESNDISVDQNPCDENDLRPWLQYQFPASSLDIVSSRPSSSHEVVDQVAPPEDMSHSGSQLYWRTTWLKRRTVLLFIVFFAACIASLLALWQVSLSENGLRLTLSSNHYAWTYGPTAILTIVIGLWRQVDFHCRTLQPWQELQAGLSDPHRSVLLDYVGPLIITSLPKALGFRHYSVAASILGFITLKMVTLFSTGLLVLEPTVIGSEHPAIVTTTFDPGQIWENFTGGLYYANFHPIEGDTISIYQNVPSLPVHAYLATMEEDLGDMDGSKISTAFQSFKPIEEVELKDFSVEVDVFVPNISCEIAKPVISVPHGNGLTSVAFESESCSTVITNTSRPLAISPCWDCTLPQIEHYYWKVNCSNPEHPEPGEVALDASSSFDVRDGLMVSSVTYKNLSYTSGNTTNLYIQPTYHQSAAVLCKTQYSVDKAVVTQNEDNDLIKINLNGQGRQLSNFTGLMLQGMIYASLYAAKEELVLPGETGYQGTGWSVDIVNPLYYLLLKTKQSPNSMEALLNSTILQNAAEEVWNGIATQFMRNYYLQPSNISSTGEGNALEDRLHVTMVSLWGMVAGFIMLVGLASAVMYTKPTGSSIPRDPRLLSTSAAILASSSEFNHLLGKCTHFRTSRLTESLRDYSFQSSNSNAFRILSARAPAPTSSMPAKGKNEPWIPVTARYYFVAITFVTPLLAIAALEVLYHVSKSNIGIATVSGSEQTASVISRYLSALTLLVIATSFNALHSTIASFAPFSLMRAGSVAAERGLQFHILGLLPPLAVWRSLKRGHYASALSNLAGIVGSGLTIAGSGLWIVDRTVAVELPATASLQSWNYTWYNSSNSGDGGAALQLNRIQHGSSTTPETIWNNTVIPNVADISSKSHSVMSTSQNFTFELESLRPALSCELVDNELVTVELNQSQKYWYAYATPPLYGHCQRAGLDGTRRYYTMDLSFPSELVGPVLAGEFWDLHLGGPWPKEPYYSLGEQGESWASLEYQPDNPAGCPSIGAMLWKTSSSNASTSADSITAILCSQKMEQVRLKVTYRGDNTTHPSIDRATSPTVIPDTAEYLTNGTDGFDTFPYRPQTYLSIGNLTSFIVPHDNINLEIDSYINNIIYGPNGTTLEDLIGRENRNNFMHAVQQLYGKYMSLVIDMKFRQPLETPVIINGTVSSYQSRLKVDTGSKLALQVMLGVMTFLGLCAFWLIDLRGTLPRKPTSIASTMAFLAGSDLCDGHKLLPENVQRLSATEYDAVFKGWLLSLGWWSRDANGNAEDSEDLEGDGAASSSNSQAFDGRTERFGIDVGVPKQLGLRETTWWRVRRRIVRPRQKT